MLLRINYENFITHMVDYFTADEILGMQYIIISAKVANQGRATNVAKSSSLFISQEELDKYIELMDKDILRKGYREELKTLEDHLFINFIQPILQYNHHMVIVCAEIEDVYTDILVEYLDKEFGLKCIDLNKLFTEGETDVFYLDRKKIRHKSKDVSLAAGNKAFRALESTPEGKNELLSNMTTSEKIKKLKSLGIKVNKSDKKHLDKMLLDEWVYGDPDE